jgi:hypothetical protein
MVTGDDDLPVSAVALTPGIEQRPLYHRKGVRPGIEDMGRPQSQHVPAESFRENVAIAIYRESILTVPFPPIDINAEAVVDQEIAVPHSRNQGLGLHVVTDKDEPQSHDRFIA